MESDAPRIGPMDFGASSLKREDARRLRGFATVAEEFSAAVARQHAEVLFQDLLKRPDREAVFRDLLAGYDPLYGGEAALGLFGTDLLPSFIEATESHLEHAYPISSFFYFHFGSLLHALDFRVQYQLWREREDVRALFAGRSNAGMDGIEASTFASGKSPDLRFYAPGTATMEDELIRAFRHTFGHRAALHVENGETAHRVRRHKRPFRSTDPHYDYSFPAYRNVNHEMQRRVTAHLTSARLADLSLSGLDIGDFASDRASYSATAAAGVTGTTVSAIPADSRAAVVIADADGSTAGRERDATLSEGANRITVTVTAHDEATMTYTVDVRVLRANGSDRDDDGLIEVASLVQLDAIRHDLDGDGTPSDEGAPAYATAFPGSAEDSWCQTRCRGYELAADLDFDTNGNGIADGGDPFWNEGAGWVPIGRTGDNVLGTRSLFRGTFDGNGHRIENLFINAPESPDAGLFGSSIGKIRRLAVVNADVTGKNAAGALVAVLRGLVEACYTSGSVTGSRAGGLVGVHYTGTVRTSFSTARVTGGSAAGGLSGNGGGRVVASYATGTVSGTGDGAAGGIVGNAGSRGPVESSYATGAVAGVTGAGGLAGAGGAAIASYWDKDTSGLEGSGGRSTSALQSPTGYEGIYEDWDTDRFGDNEAYDPWDFGSDAQYPALSVDFDGDGDASWHEFGYQLRSGPALTATPGAGEVALAWTAADAGFRTLRGELSYTVWRDGGGARETVAEGLTALEYADAEVDSETTYRYQVTAVVEGGEGARSGWVEAQAGPGPATVTITAEAASPTEGSPVSFAVTRSGPVTAALVVNVAVSETGAMLSSPPGSLTLGEGERSGALTLATEDDAVVEADSTVTAEVAAGDGYALGVPASAELTVVDNDAAIFEVAASPEAIAEGENATVAVSIANAVTFAQKQTITLTVSGTALRDEDYTLSPTELTLAAGANSAAATVAALADELKEASETVEVFASHAGESVGTVTVTIASDDATLSALALSGVPFGTFASGTTAYSASVAHGVEVTTVTATPATGGAGIAISPQDADTGTEGHQVNLVMGETAITVTVTAEDRTATQSYTVTVTRSAPPVVSGPTAFTVTEGETDVATLTATDEDTTAGNLQWTITGGADHAHFRLSTAGMLAFAAAKNFEDPDDAGTDGTYEATVQVSDGTNVSTADVSVTLANRNEAPTANAGADQSGIEGGTTVTLSGSGEDPDEGHTQGLSYAWSQTGGTSVSLSASSAATTTFTALSRLEEDAALRFTLRVTDAEGLFDEDEVQVTVLASAAPEVTGTTSFTVTEGETAVGTLTATDPDTPVGDLAWSITGGTDRAHFVLSEGGTLAFLEAKDYEAPDDAGTDGTYNLTVQVSDGTSSTTADLSVALANRNEAPTADAGPDQTGIEEGATVTLTGSGEDPDAGESLSYAWTQTGGTSVSLSAPSAATTTFTAPSGMEQDAVLAFTLRVTDGGGLFDEDEVQVTVVAPELPVVSVVPVATPVVEGEKAEFSVSRSGPATRQLRVKVTRSYSDRADATASSLLFQRGVSTKNPYTKKSDDAVVRDDRTVTLTLEDGEGYTVSAEARSAQVVVEDNDEAEFALSVEPAEITEGESATVRVEIANGVTFEKDQTITLDISGGTATKGADYEVSTESLTLRAGRSSATATVTARDEGDEEGDETLAVAARHAGETVATAEVTIVDAELPVVSVVPVATPVAEGENAEFTVSRTGLGTRQLRVNATWSYSDRADARAASLLFQRGVRTKNPYTKKDDAVVRADRTVTLTLEDGEGYTVSAEARSAQVVVQDNDEAEFALSVDPAKLTEGESATVRLEIANGVTFEKDQAITLDFSGGTATKGADYEVSSESLTLRAGRSSATATVTARDEGDEEGEETLSIAARHAGETVATAAVTIVDAELPVVSVVPVATPVAEGEKAEFTVSRSGLATRQLRVNVTWSYSDRADARAASLLFQRGVSTKNPYTKKSDDAVVRADRTVTLTLEDGEGYTVSPQARSAQVVVEDNDEAEFALSVEPAEITEGESATVRVEIANGVTFADQQAITLGFGGSTAAKGADFTVSPETLTLRGGEDSVRATVTALDDSDEEGDETVAITASRAGETIGTNSVVITGTVDTKDSGS